MRRHLYEQDMGPVLAIMDASQTKRSKFYNIADDGREICGVGVISCLQHPAKSSSHRTQYYDWGDLRVTRRALLIVIAECLRRKLSVSS